MAIISVISVQLIDETLLERWLAVMPSKNVTVTSIKQRHGADIKWRGEMVCSKKPITFPTSVYVTVEQM